MPGSMEDGQAHVELVVEEFFAVIGPVGDLVLGRVKTQELAKRIGWQVREHETFRVVGRYDMRSQELFHTG